MSRKKQFLLVAIGIILLIIGVVFKLRPKSTTTPPEPVKQDLLLVRTVPPVGESVNINPTIGVHFTFDSPLSIGTAQVSVAPEVPLRFALANEKPNTLVVSPRGSWEYDQLYTITINQGLSSLHHNKILKQDIVHQFEFKMPPQEDTMQPHPPSYQ